MDIKALGFTRENDMDIKIEKNVPVPPSRKFGMGQIIRELEVGDSFLFTTDKPQNVSAVFKSVGYKSAMRDQKDGTYRFWRIA